MVVLNTLDRFHLVMDVANRVAKLQPQAAHIKQRMRDKLSQHTQYIHEHGEDMPEIRDWKWPGQETIVERG
jgi:xylulose-5-phosphate/fructose-6-phosphate phosphoketolase